jgi:hypothetical protein
LSTILSKIWLSVGPFFRSFDHNSLVSRPFLVRKVSNRSSHHVLQNGQGVVSSIQLLVWSTVRSNLGQTWSTLVKLGQIWSKLSKLLEMYPRLHFEGFWAWWALVGLGTARSNLGQPWSNLVNPSQTWSKFSELWEMYLGPRFEGFGHNGPQSGRKWHGQLLVKLGQPWSNLVNPSQIWSNFGKCALDPVLRLFAWRALVGSGWLGSGCLVLRVDTRENPRGKNGVMTHIFV